MLIPLTDFLVLLAGRNTVAESGVCMGEIHWSHRNNEGTRLTIYEEKFGAISGVLSLLWGIDPDC